MALGGVLWFAVVGLIAGLGGGRAGPREPATDYLFPLTLVGLAVVLYFGYVSFFVLRTGCVLCLGTYACVLAITVTTWLQSRRSVVGPITRLPSDLVGLVRRPAPLAMTVLVVGGIVAAMVVFPKHAAGERRPLVLAVIPPDVQLQFASSWAAQPRVDLGVPAGGAAVVLVKFNDWMCPSCKMWHETLQPLLDKYETEHPRAIKYVVKDYPLNAGCNGGLSRTRQGHEASCTAAVAVRVAQARGRGDAMVTWLFDEQSRLVELGMLGSHAMEEIQRKLAALTGVQDFDAEAARWLPEIRRDASEGMTHQVHYTPTFFVNGVSTTTSQGQQLPLEYIELAIRLEIKKANGG